MKSEAVIYCDCELSSAAVEIPTPSLIERRAMRDSSVHAFPKSAAYCPKCSACRLLMLKLRPNMWRKLATDPPFLPLRFRTWRTLTCWWSTLPFLGLECGERPLCLLPGHCAIRQHSSCHQSGSNLSNYTGLSKIHVVVQRNWGCKKENAKNQQIRSQGCKCRSPFWSGICICIWGGVRRWSGICICIWDDVQRWSGIANGAPPRVRTPKREERSWWGLSFLTYLVSSFSHLALS